MSEWWKRHMDVRRAASIALGVVGGGLAVLGLAATPGFGGAGALELGWLGWTAPAFGGAVGMALRGYTLHRKRGTRDGLRWALGQGGAMLLVILGLYAIAFTAQPVVSSNPQLGGDAWFGLLAVGTVLWLGADVLWERSERRRRIATVMLLAFCSIIAGIVGIRTGGAWAPVGAAVLIGGILALGWAVLQGWDELFDTMSESAT